MCNTEVTDTSTYIPSISDNAEGKGKHYFKLIYMQAKQKIQFKNYKNFIYSVMLTFLAPLVGYFIIVKDSLKQNLNFLVH